MAECAKPGLFQASTSESRRSLKSRAEKNPNPQATGSKRPQARSGRVVMRKPAEFKIRSLRRKELPGAFVEVRRIVKTDAGRSYQEVLGGFERKPDYMLGCFEGGEFCGALFAFDQGKRVFVGALAVKEEHQGRSVGRKLLEEIEARARADGKKGVYLGALPDAERFYLKVGYTPHLFLQVRKDDAPKDFGSKLENYAVESVAERQEEEGLDFKVMIKVSGLDKVLQRKAKAELNAYDSIFVFEKRL